MSEKGKAGRYIVRTRALDPAQAAHIRHPLNPNSDLRMHQLSALVGMERAHLHLGTIPPGKESFVPHAHGSQEEFLFILEGSGTVEIDGDRASVGPGDYIGFPIDGAVHHLINTGAEDLVYLMGGERTTVEVSRFPTLGKIGVWSDNTMRYLDETAGDAFTIDDFVAKDEDAGG